MSDKRNIMFEIARGLIAISIAIAVAFILIFLSSDDPTSALQCLLIRPVWTNGAMNIKSVLTILGRTTPMIFTGLAVCVMFSANQFNLGGEGAVMAGGFVAALVGIYLPMAAGLHAVVSVVIGTITGGLIMIIPAVLKVKLKASEMVSSLMLNYVVMYIVLHFLNMNFADRSKGSTQTFPMEATAIVGKMATGAELTWGFPVAIIATVLVAIFMYRTRWGYAIRMIGINESFSKYSGMKVGAVLIISQVIGGALSGMGGAIEVLGRYETFRWQGLPGYGWTGLTVAILAKNNPILIPFAALFLAYLDRGCEMMSIYAGVPAEMIDIIKAVIFLFFAAEQFMAKTKHKMVVKGAKEEMKQIELAKEGGNQ